MVPVSRGRRRLAALLVAWCLLPSVAAAQTPKEAWATLRAHFADVERFRETQDGRMSQVQDLMGAASPAFQGPRASLVTLWRLLGSHWNAENSVMRGRDRSLRAAQENFAAIDAMTKRFLELADQMANRRTPDAESTFRNYLAQFSGRLNDLDRLYFTPVYSDLMQFTNECGGHESIVATHSDAARRAIDDFYQGRKNGEVGRRQMQATRETLFAFFVPWDASHGATIAAGRVVVNDWRRIHVDTAELVTFLRSPDFVDKIPDIDAGNVIDTIKRIDGYLATYR